MMGERRAANVYCSNDDFEYICFVESVYLSNLTLKMMGAYADGDIVDKIKTSLLAKKLALDKFIALCDNDDCESFTEDDKKGITKYITKRNANMRG